MMITLTRFARLAAPALLAACLVPTACAVQDAEADAEAEATSDLSATTEDCNATKNADGWCWATANHPVGRSSQLFAFGENDVYTLASGVLVRFDGTRWKPMKSSVRVTQLWGTSAQDLWAIDDGAIYRRVNGDWSKIESAPGTSRLNKIWGTSANDVWVIGSSALVMHWDGATWKVARQGSGTWSTAGYTDVHGTGPNDVWLTGVGPTGMPENQIHHWDGVTWTEVPRAVVDTIGLSVVRAFAPNDVWVGGTLAVHHFDGATWTRRSPPGMRDGVSGRGESWTVTSIEGPANDVRIGVVNQPNPAAGRLFRFANGAYTEVTLPEAGERFAPNVSAMTRLPSGKLLFAYGGGDLWREDGAASTRLTRGPQIDFERASARGATVVASGLAGAIATREGGQWVSKPVAGAGWLRDVAALQGGAVATGKEELARLAGGAVTREALRAAGIEGELRVAGTKANDFFVASDQGVWHLAGTQWSKLPHPMGRIRALALDPSGAPVVATEYRIARFDGAFWVTVQEASATAMARTPDGVLWTVRGDGLFRDGQPVALAPEVKDGLRYVTSMAACPDGRIYAVGSYGTLRAYEGGVWKTQVSDVTGNRPAAACTSDGTAWLFGSSGSIVRKAKP